MLDDVNIKLIIVPLKGWNSSDIWEQPERIKIILRKKIRAVAVRDCLISFGADKWRRMRWAEHVAL
jgi:hypothetical protein